MLQDTDADGAGLRPLSTFLCSSVSFCYITGKAHVLFTATY